MDGMNADFAGAKICPAADACQSSNRTLLGTDIVFHIEKLDKECKTVNFHSNLCYSERNLKRTSPSSPVNKNQKPVGTGIGVIEVACQANA